MPNATTKKYWKGLDEKLATDEFVRAHENEFAEELPVEGYLSAEAQKMGVSRRDFLKLMGFGLAAVSAACSRAPVKKAIPYLNKPDEVIPGKSNWYASTCAGCTAACGVLVKSRDGRPIKLEGLPESPVNRGGLCATGQASLLSLYDEGRLHGPLHNQKAVDWKQLDQAVISAVSSACSQKKKIRVLSGTLTSPTTRRVVQQFISGCSGAQHVIFDAVSSAAMLDAHEKSFGRRALPRLDFSKADLVVGLESDFLGSGISPVEAAKGYAAARKITDARSKMLRHVQFESRLSLTGASADTRQPVKPSQLQAVTYQLLAEIRKATGGAALSSPGKIEDAACAKRVSMMVQELLAARGRSAVVCGINDLSIQAAVLEINARLGNYGAALSMDAPSYQKQGSDKALADLIGEMQAGEVGVLIVYGANPIYASAQAREFSAALGKVAITISLNSFADDTSVHCTLNAPDHHYLESWNDAEPVAGVFHLTQPAINPVYNTRAAQDSLLLWSGVTQSYLDVLKSSWQQNQFSKQSRHLLFEGFWSQSVQDGFFVVPQNASGQRLQPGDVSGLISAAASAGGSFEISVYEPVALRDGAAANNPWLQELPDPITKITWDNALTLSPADALKMGVSEGDVVQVKSAANSFEVPVYVLPGQATGSGSLALGYGRTHAGKVGSGVGVNAYALTRMKSGYASHFASGASVIRTGKRKPLACTQTHHSYEGRDIVREMTLAELAHGKNTGPQGHENHEMLWKELPAGQNMWGMAVDMSACTGCSACLIGCQSENNVAVVGREEVFLRREMHWLRLDRYFSGDENNPDTTFQPMMCQHCGHAPCESVCPVAATVHSTDGLNQQVYNRCVGTRYCANNCPYKVRRFNWFDYANNPHFDYYMNNAVGKLVLNPDVVVRTRGVMEKCSMCVQRIQEGKLKAKLEGRALADGDIKLACEQSCPSDAIVFGDLANKESRVAKMIEKNPRRYRVLSELNVAPSVNYLAKVRNRQS